MISCSCNRASAPLNDFINLVECPSPKLNSHLAIPPSSDPTAHLVHVGPFQCVIGGISCRLVNNVLWCPTELHPLAFEAKVRDAGNIFLPLAEVVREEEG